MPDILIVEYEILIAEEIKDCLLRHGFGVTELAVKEPDAVVMDIKLPGEPDGIATAEKIYTQWHIPCIFFIAWNVRGIIVNHYFLFVGICHFFIALVFVFHTLSYKGMNIFVGHGTNLPTQFWILGGYFQCFTFL
ncbi:MASE3 domain-containing protein [uncultured Desulfobacter sp.]|uniref:MASE3 domain-containing protein n=1 Tax=uncultured Desulfobacter sp. TaxID=240139 RepID=UPI0029F59517|nr:MASE3 domain-containing protein [uncultured Desulfobacter sp.]